MNSRRIRINGDIYNEIDEIRKKLVEKAGLHKELSIRETMEIIWNAKDLHGFSLEEVVEKIKESNIKIAWGYNDKVRGTKAHRRGQLNVKMS